VSWNGAVPPELPAPGPLARLRQALRGGAAVVWLAGMFAVFLAARGIDLAARGIMGRPLPALAPFVLQAWAFGMVGLLGLRFRRVGAPMAHPGAVVANHAGWLDIVVMMRVMRIFFVSKSEVAGWPGIGTIGRAIGTMFIDRRPVEARRQTEALHARLKRGDRLCIFPEGTSTDGRRVLPFKSTLFAVLVAPDLKDRLWVQPVTIRYAPGRGLPPATHAWWGEMDFASHAARLLALPRGAEVSVTFHPALRAADFEDRKELAAAAEAAVRRGWAEGLDR
jgi:1-acyl-sn-glycerol-3-phosphate acyltransferase